jgi:hypothetical protein
VKREPQRKGASPLRAPRRMTLRPTATNRAVLMHSSEGCAMLSPASVVGARGQQDSIPAGVKAVASSFKHKVKT